MLLGNLICFADSSGFFNVFLYSLGFCCFYSMFLFFPFQFLSLASNILNFITSSMLNSRNNFIRNYLSVSLSEQHMATLASIIKEVDKDGLKGE